LLCTRVPQLGKRMQLEKPRHTRLKGTNRRHLLAEMVLVLADAAIPPADGLVFADHDVLCNLVEQSIQLLAHEPVIQEKG
jgi:hypothetical protein